MYRGFWREPALTKTILLIAFALGLVAIGGIVSHVARKLCGC